VRIVNPWPPGGPADRIVRPIAERLSEALGQPVIVENRAGASGAIGSRIVATAPPDGHTLLFAYISPIALLPLIEERPPYDPIADFTPITQVTIDPAVFVLRSDVPATTLGSFIDLAKASPGKFTQGSIGQTSLGRIMGEMLQARGGFSLLHVPYAGAAPLVTDLIAGRVDTAFLNVPAVQPHVESGRLRMLAATTRTRIPSLPDVPALSETFPDLAFEMWYGIMGPARMPPPVLDRMQRELRRIIREPDIAERLRRDTFVPVGSTPEEFTAQIRMDLDRFRELVSRLGLRAQ